MNNKIIYALGCFDGVHLGHRALLETCASLAERQGCSSGAVTFSNHPQQVLTGRKVAQINTNTDRDLMLLKLVDTVVQLPFTEELMAMAWQDFLQMLVNERGAAGFVCGTDFRFGRKGEGTAVNLQQYCQTRGMPCALVEQQALDGVRVSSTHIRSLLKKGDIAQANRFLGHPHRLTGKVESGKQLGRTIGIPTANLAYPQQLLTMPRGVYCAMATIGQESYLSVVNIGVRPTVSGQGITVESHLLDFSGDLYGQVLTLEFLAYLRPEQKFADLQALLTQIQKDIAVAKEIIIKK